MFIVPSALYASNPITGQIDEVYYDSNYPRHHLTGWACAQGLPDSIDVHVYAGGPAGVGHFVTAVTANLPRDQFVANACGSKDARAYRFDIALDSFLATNFGQSIYVHGISPNGGSNDLIGNSGSFTFPDGITVNVLNHPMQIRTSPTLGGSIGSLTWNGMEFVNSDDHGREFQVAAQFNDRGECFNPTEAGSLDDGTGTSPSTSQVYTYSIPAPNQFFTGGFPAFYLHYNETTGACTAGTGAQNGGSQDPLSTFNTYKIVTVGYLANVPNQSPVYLDNVIKIDTAIYIPYGVTSASIESLVGSMNAADFPQIMTYDPASRTASTASGETWVNKPVILASDDGNYALGIYNPQLNVQNNPNLDVSHYRWNSDPQYADNSWSAVFEFDATSGADTKYFTNYLIIGTLNDVLGSMGTLQDSNLPAPWQ